MEKNLKLGFLRRKLKSKIRTIASFVFWNFQCSTSDIIADCVDEVAVHLVQLHLLKMLKTNPRQVVPLVGELLNKEYVNIVK
jgi:hypothetical protein